MYKVALERELDSKRKLIAVYKEGQLISSYRLDENDDENRMFNVVYELLRNLY